MRKLLHTTAAIAALLALLTAANAADVGVRPPVYHLLQPMCLRHLVGLGSTSAATSVELGAKAT